MDAGGMTMVLAPSHSFTNVGMKREVQRRFVVRAVFFIFILSLIEGPLRKWFLPGLAGPLTLLRDPFVIMLYAYCLVHGLMRTRGLAGIWLSFAFLTSLIGGFQYILAGLPAFGWALGVRTYWLYMPLAFVVAKSFRREDVHRFLKLCLWIAIPYALLVAAQYDAPARAFLNRGVGGDEEGAVGLGRDIVRPFGLFTYTGPNVQFTAFTIAAFVAFYVGNVPIRRRWLFLLVSGAAVGTMSVLTGSRSIYFLAAMILGLTLIGMFSARMTRTNLKRALGIVSFAGLAAALFVFVFPDMLDAMANRFDRAARSEGSIWNRAFGGLIRWIDPLFTVPIFGMGIGAGATGVARMLGLPPLIYGESDLQRNVNELGLIMGSAMLALRFGLAAWIGWIAFRLARRGEVLALPLAGFAFFPFLMGQITHSPLNAFSVWLAAGIIFSLKDRPKDG